jgi:hypothetical protein
LKFHKLLVLCDILKEKLGRLLKRKTLSKTLAQKSRRGGGSTWKIWLKWVCGLQRVTVEGSAR